LATFGGDLQGRGEAIGPVPPARLDASGHGPVMVPIWRRVEEYQFFLKFETTGDEIRGALEGIVANSWNTR